MEIAMRAPWPAITHPTGRADPPRTGRVRITVVHTASCHLCDEAGAQLTTLAQELPLDVTYVEADRPDGQHLVQLHRAPMFPLILVEDEFFSFGRLSVKKLRRELDRRLERTS